MILPLWPIVLLIVGLCFVFLTVGVLHTIGVICAVVGGVLTLVMLTMTLGR